MRAYVYMYVNQISLDEMSGGITKVLLNFNNKQIYYSTYTLSNTHTHTIIIIIIIISKTSNLVLLFQTNEFSVPFFGKTKSLQILFIEIISEYFTFVWCIKKRKYKTSKKESERED